MGLVVRRGSLPATPHTEFYFLPEVLALEEVHGSYGFSGAWSRKMHVRSYPTVQAKAPVSAGFDFCPRLPKEPIALQPFLIQTDRIPVGGDALRSRHCLVFGTNTKISLLRPDTSFAPDVYFRNGEYHEIYYLHDGAGTLTSEFGRLVLNPEHYIVVPKGTTYRIDLSTPHAYMLLIESRFPIQWPPRYLNAAGQATMEAPIVETEIGIPELQEPQDVRGEFPVYVQHDGGKVSELVLAHHPFDVCGWEGALFPFSFSIHSHHAIAREIHTAPPVHQTFQSGNVPQHGFSLCSFVPQMEGWHPREVPAPYAHFNVDSDEVMFFCDASYGARKGIIREGSFTFHPGSTPHSPHGFAARKSLEARGTLSSRLAVMLDTYFESLHIAEMGWQCREQDYALSWLKAERGADITSLVP